MKFAGCETGLTGESIMSLSLLRVSYEQEGEASEAPQVLEMGWTKAALREGNEPP